MTIKKTLYQQHVEKWIHCDRCTLSQKRSNVVLYRGSIPCDILFIGEAPGQSEDILAKPFIGPAGKLLDFIIKEALDSYNLTYGITNLVGCIPKDENNEKVHEPDKECIMTCSSRLSELYKIAKPKAIICVGGLAKKYLITNIKKFQVDIPEQTPREAITHPSAILRAQDIDQSSMVKRCVIIIRDIAQQLKDGKTIETDYAKHTGVPQQSKTKRDYDYNTDIDDQIPF